MRTDYQLTPDFRASEVWCPCAACEAAGEARTLIADLLAALQAIRTDSNAVMRVTAGIRCAAHNAAIGGAPDSRHLVEHADAVDIACSDSAQRFRLIALAYAHGITFVEVCPEHLHFDMRPGPGHLIVGTDH